MSRLIRLIIALYPPSLRSRYGAEMRGAALRQMSGRDASGRLAVVGGLLAHAAGAWLDMGRSAAGALVHAVTRREGVRTDLRSVLRGLAIAPVFTVTVVTTLALGVGLNAAVFSVIHAVVLRSLPFDEPERLVRIHGIDPRNGHRDRPLTPAHLDAIRSAPGVAGAVGVTDQTRTLAAEGAAWEVTVARVTGDIVRLLGLDVALGRGPSAMEWEEGEPVVLLSHSLWRSTFGSDPGVPGRLVTLGDRAYTVVGVLAAGAVYPEGAGLLRPMTVDERADGDPELSVIARLAPGWTRARMEEAVRARTVAYLAAGADELPGLDVWVRDARAALVGTARGPLLLVQAAAFAILLVTCFNLAHLLLMRGESRRSSLAVRAAVGAQRGHLLRLVLMEGLVLAVAGGFLGLLIGRAALPVLLRLAPAGLPRVDEVSMDIPTILILSAGVGVLLMAFAAGPALRASGVAPSAALATRGARGRVGKRRASSAFVVGEVAISTTLATAAVLLAISLARLATAERGYEPDRLLYLPVTPASAERPEQPDRQAYEAALLHEVRALPGVDAAALASQPPTSTRGINFSLFDLEGLPVAPEGQPVRGGVVTVSQDYFETVGLDVVEGRSFTLEDRSGGEPVAIVSRAFARRFLRAGEGATFRIWGKQVRVVGVVEDTRPVATEPSPELLYLPLAQAPFSGSLLVRSSGEPWATARVLRDGLFRFDPLLPTNRLIALAGSDRVDTASFQAWLVGLFASLALLVSVVGIYGVTASAVQARVPEIGVRLALGATGSAIRWMVLRGALGLAGLGVLLGLSGAVAASGLLRRLLFGVHPLDPAVLLGVAAALGVVAAIAAWAPAARASRIPPARVLGGQ